MSGNSERKMEIDKKWRKDTIEQWTKNSFLKEPEMMSIITCLAHCPKFDPRFPFDRTYKLMKGLRLPVTLKFPSTNSYI